MNNATRTAAIVCATTAFLFANNAQAQTLAKYASPDAVFALEINDWDGVKKRAGAFTKKFETLNLPQVLLEAYGEDTGEMQFIAKLDNLIGRDALVAVSINPRSKEPNVLVVARPNQNQQSKTQQLLTETIAAARKDNTPVKTLKAGNLPYWQVGKNGEANYMGYAGGLAYASSDATILATFLKRAQNLGSGQGLAQSTPYKNVMDNVGAGAMRVYVNVADSGRVIKETLADVGEELGKINAAPIADAIIGLGRWGGAWRVTATGLETSTFQLPNANSDPTLARLMTTPPRLTPNVHNVVPATATNLNVSSINVSGWYDYFNNLVNTTKLNPGGLDKLFIQEFGFDPRKAMLPWMTGEFAQADFPLRQDGQAQTVFYMGTNDEAAAKSGMDAFVPRIAELANNLAQTGAKLGKPGKAKISGVEVVRYPIAPNVAIVTGVRNGYLIVAFSDAAMLEALRSGPRLADNAKFKTALARIPDNASAFSYGDTAGAVKNLGDQFGPYLDLALGQGLDLKPSTARQLSKGISELLAFTAERVGEQTGWTVIQAGGVLTRSSLPVRW